MNHPNSQIDSPESRSITLIEGTVTEIVSALKELWASPATIAKASVSFDFRKIPDATVFRDGNTFHIGNSVLTEWVSKVVVEQQTVQTRWQKLMSMPAANDGKYALAA